MKVRFPKRVRHQSLYPEALPIEQLGRSKRGYSMQIATSLKNKLLEHIQYEQITEDIEAMNKENKFMHLENMLFSYYLRRVSNLAIVETFDQYTNQYNRIDKELNANPSKDSSQAKLPKIARRLSMRKDSINTTNAQALWMKLTHSMKEAAYAPLFLRINQEKLSIAIYEHGQMRLDWQRMKDNAHLELDRLEILLRTAESEKAHEETLNNDLVKYLSTFHKRSTKDNSRRSSLTVPVHVLINQINRRIEAQSRLVAFLHIDRLRTEKRMQAVNVLIQYFDNLREKLDEADIKFVRAKQIDHSDRYYALVRQYEMHRSSQYPVLQRLQEQKSILATEERRRDDDNYKIELIQHHIDKLDHEIAEVKHENKIIVRQNNALKDRIATVKSVPTVAEYAYIIERTTKLRHDIDVWTRRVYIAETILSQLKRQAKSPTVLPPLQSNRTD